MRSLDSITRAFRRATLALGCALALGACATWVEAPTPAPAPDALRKLSSAVRVVQHDGSSVQLRNAYVRGDTLYGYSSETRVAVPLREVAAILRKETELERSSGALAASARVVLTTLLVGIVYFILES